MKEKQKQAEKQRILFGWKRGERLKMKSRDYPLP